LAQKGEKTAYHGFFMLEVKDSLVNLKSDQASFKDILNDLEKKTGIKVNIFDDVNDKKVTLNIRDLPVDKISRLLEKMELQNVAVVYDEQLSSRIIYILSEGEDTAKITRGKTVLYSTQNIEKDSNISSLDNPEAFELMKKIRNREKQAIMENLEKFPLPKFINITNEISLNREEVDDIAKAKAREVDIPPEIGKNIAAVAVMENKEPDDISNKIIMQDGSVTYLFKIKLEEARRISVQFQLKEIHEDAFVLAYSMHDNEIAELRGPIPYTPRNDFNLVIPSIFSDEIYIEIRNLPAKLSGQSEPHPFLIRDIQYFNSRVKSFFLEKDESNSNNTRSISTANLPQKVSKSTTCSGYKDINCIRNNKVRNLKNGIVKLDYDTRSGIIYLCTGAIIKDNEALTDIPYILTAGHCLVGNGYVREVHFWNESASCNSSSKHRLYRSTTLPVYILRDEFKAPACELNPDWALLKMNIIDPSLEHAPRFLRTKSSTQPVGDRVYQIHHPAGAKKKFSKGVIKIDHNDTQEIDYDSDSFAEGGTSGSPYFYKDDLKIIGIHNCSLNCTSSINTLITKYSNIHEKIRRFIQPSVAKPKITSVKYPCSVVTDKYFFLTIKVKNTGTYQSPKGLIHIAFPSYKSPDDKTLVSVYKKSGDLVYKEYPQKYSRGLSRMDGTKDRSAKYLHVEAVDINWLPGETNRITLKIKPNSEGTMKLWYRAAMQSENEHYYNTPSNSNITDSDQQWPVKEISINVINPGDPVPIISGDVTLSSTQYNSFVRSPFNITATFTDNEKEIISCEYCVSKDGICNNEWAKATLSGSGSTRTCKKTGITAKNGQTLRLNMRATGCSGTGTAVPITVTVDSTPPATTDNSLSDWTHASPVTVTLTPDDGSGSGVKTTKHCVDTANSCIPDTAGTSVDVNCPDNNECVQYARYFSEDNTGNKEKIRSRQIRQDTKPPTDGFLVTSKDDRMINLSWNGFSDTGCGLNNADSYRLVYSTAGFPSVNCTDGTEINDVTVQTRYAHTDLINDITYYYRMCAYDELGHLSQGVIDSATPIPRFNLNTSVIPPGSGNVRPYCASGCGYFRDTILTLSHKAKTAYAFEDWEGCDLTSGGVCTVTMNENKDITANFSGPYAPINLVWQDNIKNNYEIYFKQSTDGGKNWTTKRLTNNKGKSSNPVIAAKGSNIYVTWHDNTENNYEIYFMHSANKGKKWSKPMKLTKNKGKSSHPVIAVNGSNVYLVWQDNTDNNYEIYFMHSADKGKTWSKPMRLTENEGKSSNPVIAVKGSNVYVVWQDNTRGNYKIYFMRSTSRGQKWSKPMRLTNNKGNSLKPTMAVNGSNVYLVWQDNANSNYEIYFKHSTNGGKSWKTKRLTENKGSSLNPAITVKGSYVYMVWQDNTDKNNEIYFMSSTDKGEIWTEPAKLTDNKGESLNPSVMVDKSNIYTVWQDNTDMKYDIHSIKSKDRGNIWETPKRITNNKGESTNPKM
jgi:hypothetical protein